MPHKTPSKKIISLKHLISHLHRKLTIPLDRKSLSFSIQKSFPLNWSQIFPFLSLFSAYHLWIFLKNLNLNKLKNPSIPWLWSKRVLLIIRRKKNLYQLQNWENLKWTASGVRKMENRSTNPRFSLSWSMWSRVALSTLETIYLTIEPDDWNSWGTLLIYFFEVLYTQVW